MHIGFGQNTVSSLYGHQKGDHMKTIGFLIKSIRQMNRKKNDRNIRQGRMPEDRTFR